MSLIGQQYTDKVAPEMEAKCSDQEWLRSSHTIKLVLSKIVHVTSKRIQKPEAETLISAYACRAYAGHGDKTPCILDIDTKLGIK
jgi:hypothetical protein